MKEERGGKKGWFLVRGAEMSEKRGEEMKKKRVVTGEKGEDE